MISTFGFGVLIITFLLCLYGIGAAVYGARKNRRIGSNWPGWRCC